MQRGDEALRRIGREGEARVCVRRGHKAPHHRPAPPHSYHLQVGYFVCMGIFPYTGTLHIRVVLSLIPSEDARRIVLSRSAVAKFRDFMRLFEMQPR